MTSSHTLLKYSDLPEWRKDNPAILTEYRKETGSWRAIICGPWLWHNETVNIWSHFLGALATTMFLLVWKLSVTDSYMYSTAHSETWHDRWVLGVFPMGAVVCFVCSTIFHSSTCHSRPARGAIGCILIITYADTGILVLGSVNFFPSIYYAFFCDPHLRTLYICSMTLSGCTGVYLVCAPTYASPAYRRMRTYTFFALGVVVVFPFIHCVVRYGFEQASKSLSLGWIAVEIAAYVGGALLYAERFPECIAPGKFDIIGASHQIFHICSLAAVSVHFIAVSQGYRYWHIERNGLCL
ncbi:hemolysin-III related-domain-containing protein [Mycena galericulata]|nr:hemolysin-III related-domain-containing protein [Mycena galericulata]